ncbi:MAG: hypothetical protein PW792_02305 [Acidobacteriaceae bacterium]|nr:hypothetical protein [Acidobacteriaceae bacterium]
MPSPNPRVSFAPLASIVAAFVLVIAAAMVILPAYHRYQARQDETNIIAINELKIQQTAQLVQVEKQKAEIRVVEAQGISEAQRIINTTLTDRYLQHEAIGAQEKMANSPNHTTIYIPSGQNGIPLVRTVDEQPTSASPKD